jgi:hypothetical protein
MTTTTDLLDDLPDGTPAVSRRTRTVRAINVAVRAGR